MYKGEHRPLVLILFFSIISLGIFNLYWLYIVTHELKQVTGDKNIHPAFEVVISVLTLGLYMIFWAYKYGKYIVQVQKDFQINPKDYAFLCAVLTGILLFPLTMMIMQKQLNGIWNYGE